jgi:hypothetical protein
VVDEASTVAGGVDSSTAAAGAAVVDTAGGSDAGAVPEEASWDFAGDARAAAMRALIRIRFTGTTSLSKTKCLLAPRMAK